MKRIGIDYGTKKIGIALTDDGGMMAFPHEVVPNDGSFLSYLEKLIAERGVEEVVIGHSLNNEGESNPVHEQVTELITDLTLSVGIPVHLEPEQYSTQEAMQLQGKTKQTDASAAAIILNSFITKQR
jgi:putative Holliday junction resolvase